MVIDDLMINKLIISPVIESSIGIWKENVNNNPTNTPADIITSFLILTAFAISMELFIFFPCLF